MNTARMARIIGWIAHPIIGLAGYYTVRAYLLTQPANVEYYRYALYSFLGVVILMEFRVLLGKRGKRDWIFYVHLFAGASVLVLLATLGFLYTSALLENQALLFSSITAATGFFLLHRKSYII